MAQALFRKNYLTRFQAERLLEGRHRGFQIGDYRLLEVLGAGGMGWMYLARHLVTGEVVALKVLSDRHKHDTAMRARFQLEARAGMELDHPRIVKTHRLDHVDDLYGAVDYVVMEFVEGINLQECIDRQGVLTPAQACDVVCQLADALNYAHKRGMVHRDLKPANVLIKKDGTVKLLDFGLALIDRHNRREEDQDEFSLAMIFGQDCLGTDDYISPEQTRDSRHVDGRADQYSLGCTMYFLLTGKVPYPLSTVQQKLEAHREAPPADPRERNPSIPDELANVILRMTAKKPEDRFPTMQHVQQALAPFARRTPMEFDWHVVLSRRAREARVRLAGQRSKTSRVIGSASSVAQGASSTASGKSWSGLESAVRKDPNSSDPTAGLTGTRIASPNTKQLNRLASAHLTSSGIFPAVSKTLGYLVPSGNGDCIPLSKSRILIGRHQECDIQIPDPQISWHHCELINKRGVWTIQDRGSTQGVKVNNAFVKGRTLRSGDKIELAPGQEYQITYSAPGFGLLGGFTVLVVVGILAAAGYFAWEWLSRPNG
jgi:serine/threonine-protein kinase